jgi:hypothetical protein
MEDFLSSRTAPSRTAAAKNCPAQSGVRALRLASYSCQALAMRMRSGSQVCASALICLVAQLLLLPPHVHGARGESEASFSQQGASDCLWADLVVGDAEPLVHDVLARDVFTPRTESARDACRTRDCLADAPKHGPP